MSPLRRTAAKVLTGISVTAMCAFAQYTISARPGVVNAIEGDARLNGVALGGQKPLNTTYMNANDTLSTASGKAEILLSPGAFLRVGDNSEIRMISPSLVHTQFEVVSGEAMVEITNLEKDCDVQVIDHGASVTLDKIGLYRFTGESLPTVATLEGKASVAFAGKNLEVGKGHEALLGADLKQNKFDTKKADDLYAWSNVRDQYSSAASLQTARNINNSSYGGGWYGFGFDGWASPGWYWNGAFGSYAWLPGLSGAYYSPFGYGFYGPGVVAFAPVVYLPAGTGAGYVNGKRVPPGTAPNTSNPKVATMAVAVNPNRPPAIGQAAGASISANNAARSSMARAFSSTGYSTVGGGHISARAASMGAPSASNGGGGSVGRSAATSGGFSGGGHTSGGPSHR